MPSPRPHRSPDRRAGRTPLRDRAWRGRLAEHLAAAWLRLHGWSVAGRRRRLAGVEVDLVCRRGDLALVVEVKSRSAGPGRIPAADLVSEAQRRRLERAAEALAWRWNVAVRVDLVEVRWRPWPSLRWHRNPWRALPS